MNKPNQPTPTGHPNPRTQPFELIRTTAAALLAALLTLWAAPNARADAFTWDATSGTAGAQDGGGTWANAAGNWRNTTTSTDNQNWANGDNSATFGAGTDGTYGITLSGTVQCGGGITFASSGYTLSGTSLLLNNTSLNNGSLAVNANKTATFDSLITYQNNKAAAITVNSGGILNLGGGAGNSQYNFSGDGTVNITLGSYIANIGTMNVATFNQSGGTFTVNPGNNNGYTIGSNPGRNVNYTLSGTATLLVRNNAGSGTGAGISYLRIGNATTSDYEAKLTVQSGATMTVGSSKYGELQIASSADSNGKFDVQGGDVTIAAGVPAANQIYLFKAGASSGYTASMTQSGGTVTANGIQFGGTSGTYDAASSATLQLSGGSLYVGAQGITRGSGATDLPVTIQLQGGTLGAVSNWSSSLDMKLGTTGGGPTIRAQNSGGNNRNISLSGNLSHDGAVNGTLTKSGGGDLTLSGNNNYSGGTTITAGRLFISGADALPTTGSVQVGDGGDDRLVFNVGGSLTFNQSITLADGAALVMRETATLNNVTLPTAGLVNFNRDNATTVGFTLDSDVALSGNLTIEVGGGGTPATAPITLAGDFSGDFGVTKTQPGTLILAGVNTYSGDTTVNTGTLTLADNGQLKFFIGANGVNNQVAGTATVNLDGDFNLDLSGAAAVPGNSWNLVDVGALTNTFGATFSVTSTLGAFTENANVWTLQSGVHSLWTFTESTGVLGFSQPNNAPAAQAISMGARAGVLTSLQIIGGKNAPTDADGDTLTLSSVSYTSGNGAAVAINGNSVEHTAASGFAGTDTFDYTVSDGFGGTDTKTITVTVTSANAASLNVVYGPTVVGSDFVVRFAGVPGTTYTVETNAAFSGPGWVKFNNYTAPTEVDLHPYGVGIFQVTKPDAGEPSLYFRTIHPSY